MSNTENDPFNTPAPGSTPSFNAGFETDVTEVGKLAGAMDNLARATDKADGSLDRLSRRGKQVQSSIHGILAGAGLNVGGGGGGNGNGGNPTVSGGAGGGRGNGGLTASMGGVGGVVAADFGLDLMRYVSGMKIPGYGRMQNQLQQGLPLDAYASQWAGAYGRPPSQIPSGLVKGGAIGTPGQVAAAAQYGASMGAIPGVTQQGNTYWSSVNQLQRMAPGMGSEQAAQISGNLLNPNTNAEIARRYGLGAAPMGQGGITKSFNQAAADILKALKMVGRSPGQMPTREQLLAGLLPGSRMRQQMRVGMGLDDETITMIINWGINNSAYQSKGGTGNYDPSDVNQRKLATGSGNRDSLSNYAQTYQQAQTGRTANFMQGQYGALQDMVQVQTTITDTLSKVDDAFTGLYAIVGPAGPVIGGLLGMVGNLGGAIIALRAFSGALLGAAGTSGTAGVGSGIAGAIGAGGPTGAALGIGGAAIPIVAGGALASGISSMVVSRRVAGNPEKAKHVNDITNLWHPERWDVGALNPMNWFGDLPIGDPPGTAGMSGDFKKSLGRMMAANPNITVTSGYRSGPQQGNMNRAGVGKVGAAGDSWHVRGKAADLGPSSQFGWIAKNASKFGLDSGARLGEPWHVQQRGTAGKKPPENLAINQSARGAGRSYRPFNGPVGDLPGLSISSLLSQSLSVNASNLFGVSASSSPGSSAGGVTGPAAGGGQIDKVIAFAHAQLGKPYSASQPDGPDSWDCSGLVTGAYKTIGVILPSLTFSQVKMGAEVPIDPGAVRPGDCLFMRGGSPSTDLGHVAIAISSSQMISAPHTGAVVHISSIPWSGVQAIRRYVNASSAPSSNSVNTSGSWEDFLNSHMETNGKLDPNATMSGPQIAAAFYNAGFRGNPLVDMVAISGRESGWNPTAFNFHAKSTGDVSLGLTQINVKGSMINRLKDYGLNDPRQLLDPNNAAHASFVLSSGGTNLSPWGGYKGMSNTYGTNMQSAQQAVDAARQQGMIGDLPVGGGGGGGSTAAATGTPSSYAAMSLTSGHSGGGSMVNLTQNFYIQGVGDSQGVGLRVAQVAGQKIREQFAARTT